MGGKPMKEVDAVVNQKVKRKEERKFKIGKSKHKGMDDEYKYFVPIELKRNLLINMKFTSQNIEEVKVAFRIFDKKGDGTIPTKALVSLLRALGQNPTEEEIHDMINEIDFFGTGNIEFHIFLEIWAKYSFNMDETIKEAFALFDKDGSGAISLEEFRKTMVSEGAKMSDKEIDEIMREADVDGDGQLNIDEFVQLLVQN